jgi:hypothetical protein
VVGPERNALTPKIRTGGLKHALCVLQASRPLDQATLASRVLELTLIIPVLSQLFSGLWGPSRVLGFEPFCAGVLGLWVFGSRVLGFWVFWLQGSGVFGLLQPRVLGLALSVVGLDCLGLWCLDCRRSALVTLDVQGRLVVCLWSYTLCRAYGRVQAVTRRVQDRLTR